MRLLKLFMYCSIFSTSYLAFADRDTDSDTDIQATNNDDELNDEYYLQSDASSLPATYDWTAEDLRFAAGMGGGGGGGGHSHGGGGGHGRGWGYNPFKWSSGPRTWYNPFSWGNPSAPVTTVVTAPPTGGDDELDAQIDAANRRAKKLEFLLAKQKQIQALQELNQQGAGAGAGGGGGGGGDAP